MLEECPFEEAEYAIFETDKFGMVNPGEIYEILRNEATEEAYILDKQGKDNYGVFMDHKATYHIFIEITT